MNRALLTAYLGLCLSAALAEPLEIIGFKTKTGITFQGATVSNYYTLEFAPAVEGPWTNWGSVTDQAITGTVMSLPSPFFYRIRETDSSAFPPYATTGHSHSNITSAMLASGAVSNSNIANGAVTEDSIATGAITSNKIALGAVTSAAIVDGAIGSSQLSSNLTITGMMAANSFQGNFNGNGAGLTNLPVSGFAWQVVSGTNQQAQSNKGYLCTNETRTIITLPAAPSIGDTVRVTGAGEGGWKLTQNAGQVVLSDTAISTAFVSEGDRSEIWWSVASSADGSRLVAVVRPGLIYTSTNSGETWTSRAFLREWRSVASSADGSKLVAAAYNDPLYTSADSGVTWTPRDSIRQWFSVASSGDGTKLVAVEYNGQIYTSTDSGVTWTPRDSARQWNSVASSADGTKLVAVEYNGQIYTSTDSGVTWIPRETTRNWISTASSADGTRLAAVVFNGQIYTSTDSGVTWTPRATTRDWSSVASSADGVRLVAGIAGQGGRIYTSADSGLTWTPRLDIRYWRAVASSADGTKLVAAVQDGQIFTVSLQSTVGVEGYVAGGKGTSLELQYIGNGQFLPVSHEGSFSSY